MTRLVVLLTAFSLVWLTNSSLTRVSPTRSKHSDFDRFLRSFSPHEFSVTFSSGDFNPLAVVADGDGVYVDHEGNPVEDRMMPCEDLLRWYKGKQTHPGLVSWLNKYRDSLSVNWYELFPGIRISTPKLEILSVHNYTGRSVQEGGTTQNWLLYFNKKGKLLKTVKLSDDVFSYGYSSENNAMVSYYSEMTEVISQQFDLCSENELQTVTSTYSSVDYFGSLPRDTAYFHETQNDPVLTSTIIELK